MSPLLIANLAPKLSNPRSKPSELMKLVKTCKLKTEPMLKKKLT